MLLIASAFGQAPTPSRLPDPTTAAGHIDTYNTQGAVVKLTVLSGPRTRLDRQAVVKLRNEKTQEAVWQTTTDAAEASFGDLVVGSYDVEVSAVGFLTAHKT
ncbi:MAG TPA: carboxypeptidase-like regulatory domain-containing protein, partial [Terriglobales bacterium]|nr:carboxypeptidase-like regulatory domain-containing protein [Terriglobales bacterium]